MELGNVQLQKLFPEEREKCMKEGLCLRSREKGHMAKSCPKGRKELSIYIQKEAPIGRTAVPKPLVEDSEAHDKRSDTSPADPFEPPTQVSLLPKPGFLKYALESLLTMKLSKTIYLRNFVQEIESYSRKSNTKHRWQIMIP